MSKKEVYVVYEILKREDGSMYALGCSVECDSQAKADALVSAGTHKFLDKPLGKSGAKPKPKKPEGGSE
jgi:hypothetical protein